MISKPKFQADHWSLYFSQQAVMGPEKVKASLIYIKQKLKTYSPNNSASYEEHPESQV